ncbi:MAG: ankyrin repeat-containing protein [Satyrvirus sp.]|uniref:Ankyrin repeat-containing protein n=1 Tax=Satyrvirus sp. TaxID=2487771 RepID=A0A3G5AEP6_9VIRU|nr:MAG: ankyrin repeat-containing protein [Satyrvirus sp.]
MYFKITNKNENHHGFQYKDGLNILDKKFDDNPENSCAPGGLYFTTKEFIHKFYKFGIYLRIVELPIDDPEFRMVNTDGDKWRANKIILKERYFLSDPSIYTKFDIGQLGFAWSCYNDNPKIIEHLVKENVNISDNALKDYILWWACKHGYLEVAKFSVENGANIHATTDHALWLASSNGHLEIVKLLINKGANVDADNGCALLYALKNGHEEVVKLLMEK